MRSYDGESSSCEEDDRRDVISSETRAVQQNWPRSSHPNWAWDHRGTVLLLVSF